MAVKGEWLVLLRLIQNWLVDKAEVNCLKFWFDVLLLTVLLLEFILVIGEEGDAIRSIRPWVFPESLIPNGSFGLSCFPGE